MKAKKLNLLSLSLSLSLSLEIIKISTLFYTPLLLYADSCNKLPFTVQCPSVSCDVNIVHISQADVGTTGYVIAKPGVYCIIEDLVAPGNIPVITITSSDAVVLKGNGFTIDLNNQRGTGILISGTASDITIQDVNIQNTGAPLAKNVTPTQPDFSIDLSLCTLQELQVSLRAGLSIQNPLPLDNPFSCTGIGITSGARNITIEGCKFYNCFIGISSNGQVHNITIDKCQAFDGGFDYGPSFGVCPLRGGFVIFWNGANPPVHGFTTNNASNILVSDCVASSDFWQFGVAGFWLDNVTVKNCNVNCKIANTGDFNTGSGFTEGDCIVFIYSRNITILDCISTGGQDGQALTACIGGYIARCQSFNYSDQGVDVDASSYIHVQDCTELINQPVFSGSHLFNDKSWGISGVVSDHLVIENCVVINDLRLPVIAGGSGIIIAASDSVVKNCDCEFCEYGIVFWGCTQCKAWENSVIGNILFGLIDVPLSFFIPGTCVPSVGNLYYENQAQDNGTNYLNIPFVVSTSMIGATGTAVSPWVNLAP